MHTRAQSQSGHQNGNLRWIYYGMCDSTLRRQAVPVELKVAGSNPGVV